MLENIIKGRSFAFKISLKCAVSILMIVLAVSLPQLAHIIGGTAAGAVYLPMYAPVLLAGCILGWKWGLCIGIISPVISLAFTSAVLGSAMPAVDRLPFMVSELAVFGLIGGIFSEKIFKNEWLAFPAVIFAQLSGRAVYFIGNLIAGGEIGDIAASLETGLTGLYIQVAVVPLLIIILVKALKRVKENV